MFLPIHPALVTATCEDLAVAASATESDDVVGTFTTDDISCGPWTIFEIQQNRLKLVGDSTAVVKFYNARFYVSEGAVLRLDVPVDLTGDNLPNTVRVCRVSRVLGVASVPWFILWCSRSTAK